MSDVVLLDMDGTLAEPRQIMSDQMAASLVDLSYVVNRIGIVSGSGSRQVIHQCGEKITRLGRGRSIFLLPCNGTQVFKHNEKNETWDKVFSVKMIEYLGVKDYNVLLSRILNLQSIIAGSLSKTNNFPISGHFVSFRNSILNWSMVGRDSSIEDRKIFVESPFNVEFRLACAKALRNNLPEALREKLEIVLAGESSLDIYPNLWNKTYALKHFRGKTPWFVGDKCSQGENDFHIYQELNKSGRAFVTRGPEHTIEIIDSIIDRIRSENEGVV